MNVRLPHGINILTRTGHWPALVVGPGHVDQPDPVVPSKEYHCVVCNDLVWVPVCPCCAKDYARLIPDKDWFVVCRRCNTRILLVAIMYPAYIDFLFPLGVFGNDGR